MIRKMKNNLLIILFFPVVGVVTNNYNDFTLIMH